MKRHAGGAGRPNGRLHPKGLEELVDNREGRSVRRRIRLVMDDAPPGHGEARTLRHASC